MHGVNASGAVAVRCMVTMRLTMPAGGAQTPHCLPTQSTATCKCWCCQAVVHAAPTPNLCKTMADRKLATKGISQSHTGHANRRPLSWRRLPGPPPTWSERRAARCWGALPTRCFVLAAPKLDAATAVLSLQRPPHVRPAACSHALLLCYSSPLHFRLLLTGRSTANSKHRCSGI